MIGTALYFILKRKDTSSSPSGTPKPSDIYGSWVKTDSVESITINKDNSVLYTNNNPKYNLNYSYNGKYDPINKYICTNDYMCQRFDDPNEQYFFKVDPSDNNVAIRSDNYGHSDIFTRV